MSAAPVSAAPGLSVAAGAGGLGLGVVFVGLGLAPGSGWIEPVGVAAHLVLLPVASGVRASPWARAAGYAWLALDSVISVALINGLDASSALALRLGGHVLAAMWIASAARLERGPTRWIGWGAAVTIGLHSFLAPFIGSPGLLAAAGPLLALWLLAVAISIYQRPLPSFRPPR